MLHFGLHFLKRGADVKMYIFRIHRFFTFFFLISNANSPIILFGLIQVCKRGKFTFCKAYLCPNGVHILFKKTFSIDDMWRLEINNFFLEFNLIFTCIQMRKIRFHVVIILLTEDIACTCENVMKHVRFCNGM